MKTLKTPLSVPTTTPKPQICAQDEFQAGERRGIWSCPHRRRGGRVACFGETF